MVDERIQEILRRFDTLTASLMDPEVLADPERLRETAREHSELTPVAETARRLAEVRSQLEGAREMAASGEDPELIELAELEVEELGAEEERLNEELRHLMTPRDPLA